MKVAFFDIDGTLWDEKKFIPDSTKIAIKKFRENGNMAFLCSGRARGNIISDELFAIGFDGVLAACGNYIELNGEVIYNNLLEQDLLRKVIEVVDLYRMPVVLEGPNTHWISAKGFENDPYIDNLYKQLGKGARTLYGYESDMIVNKFSADIKEYTDYASIKRVLGEEFDFIEHEGNVVECVPKASSKATGIEKLCKHLNISIEDTFGFGDSINDKDMLEYVGHGICMGNGTETAKTVADYITTELHNDGIYNALMHFELI